VITGLELPVSDNMGFASSMLSNMAGGDEVRVGVLIPHLM
jgi:hypothetical protein